MSTHFVHNLKYSHDKRRGQFKQLLSIGRVRVIRKDKNGVLYQSVPPYNYRISRKGSVINDLK